MSEIVECRSDAAYGERPLAFSWQGVRFGVGEITGRWRSPKGKGFRVKTRPAGEFELFYDESSDQWLVTEL